MRIKISQICEIFLIFSIKTIFYSGVSAELEPASDEENQTLPPLPKNPADDALLFQTVFRMKHDNLKEATKAVVALDYAKQHQMITLVVEKMSTVLAQARAVLESSGYVPGGEFPTVQKVQEALSNVMENTVLFGELLLRLPDIVHGVMKGKQEVRTLINWSVLFCNQTNLLDPNGMKLIHLTAQEFNLIEKDPDYVNPYRNAKGSKESYYSPEILTAKEKKKKKKEKKRGPTLSSARFSGEL